MSPADENPTTPDGPDDETAPETRAAGDAGRDAAPADSADQTDPDGKHEDGGTEPDGEEFDEENARAEAWRRGGKRTLKYLLRTIVAIAGVMLGVLIGGHTTADIGPIRVSADLLVGPGDTTLRIPPLGALEIDAFDAPIRMQMTMLQVDQEEATHYINQTKSADDLMELADTLEADLRSTLTSLAVQTTLWALAGGIVFSLLLFRRWQDGLIAAGLSLVLLTATGLSAAFTFNAQALEQPKYTGLLSQAPTIFGNVEDLGEKFADYRQSLVKMVTNVSKLYTTVSTLPADPDNADTIKVLHISDIHMNPEGFDLATQLAEQFDVDFVIDTGDLVDWGTPHEAATFSAIGQIDVPYIYIRGNHDSLVTQEQVKKFSNVTVLDNSTVEVEGITIAGVGDARFSPDRSTYNNVSLQEAIEKSAQEFEGYLKGLPEMPDVVLFHDPAGAEYLADSTPLILSGHTHSRSSTALDDDTLLLVQGSTGGAGLRGLENEEPTPLEASILYFDATTHELRAWDDITVGGLGESDVSIQRRLTPDAVAEAEEVATSIVESEQSASESAESASSESSSNSSSSSGSGASGSGESASGASGSGGSSSSSNSPDAATEPDDPSGEAGQPTTTSAPQSPGN